MAPLDSQPPLIELDGVTFGYNGKAVVRVDHLHLHHGRCLGIFGPNGSGKTTLVRGVTGLFPPMSGRVAANPRLPRRAGTRSADVTPNLSFGYLPQYRNIDSTWPMSAFDAAALAISAHARFGWVSRRERAAVLAAMRRLEVESLAARSFATLSGGQQQRVLLAGALAADPQVLVLDEPTDGLDVRSRRNLLDLLRQLTTDGLCTAIISHDVEDLLAVCHDIAWVHPADIAGEPSHVQMISPQSLAERILSGRRNV